MTDERRQKIDFAFLNAGHFFDHFLILIFATVAVAMATDRQVEISGVSSEWGMSYAELIPFSVAGFTAFGLCSVPAGWIADKWSRPGMIAIFFLGMGSAAMLTALASSPWHLAAALLLIGVFGAIYHPVGIAMVVQGRDKTGMAIAMNGVFGNLGVAAAPLECCSLAQGAPERAPASGTATQRRTARNTDTAHEQRTALTQQQQLKCASSACAAVCGVGPRVIIFQ